MRHTRISDECVEDGSVVRIVTIAFYRRLTTLLVGLLLTLCTMASDFTLAKGGVPQVVEIVVRGGQVVTISGNVHCCGLTKSIVNAVKFQVSFSDKKGLIVSSGVLPEDEHKNEVFYANGDIGCCRFSRAILVPDRSCKLELMAIPLWGGGQCEIRGLSIGIQDQSAFLGDAFSLTWWSARLRDWFSGGMSPSSLGFCCFVIIMLLLYFVLPAVLQPWILLLGSVAFYSMFNIKAWCFLGASIISVYLGGLLMSVSRIPRGICGSIICLNLGLLAFTKYGATIFSGTSILIPLGISFYTLQVISYLVDLARGELRVERNPFKLALYLTYFPLIMQGPISRYGQLGPQLWARHDFDLDRVRDGIQLALWGAFKKMVIADRAAIIVDKVFAPESGFEGISVLFAAVLYSIQIYADFSGCVDISRGVSQCLGIDLIKNFNHPYFAESVQDFWRRWHISLSSWLRDYVYIPLGGNRRGMCRKYVNVLLVFAVSGLWHGTGMNFFVWGLLHGIFQIIDVVRAKIGMFVWRGLGIDASAFLCRMCRIIVTFSEVTFAWILFRAQDCPHAVSIIKRMMAIRPRQLLDTPWVSLGLDRMDLAVLLVAIGLLLGMSIFQERKSVRCFINNRQLCIRWFVSMAGIMSLVVFGMYGTGYRPLQFIYMQF